MTSSQLLPVAAALAIALVLSASLAPLADLIGRRHKLIRHRASGEGRGLGPLSYASGTALGLATLAGLAIANGLAGAAGGVVVGGVAMLWLGVADDRSRRGGVRGWVRLLVETFVALLAYGAGARLPLAPSSLTGLVLSIALLVLLANAFTFLDVMGGVAPATGAACAAGLLALGIAGRQPLEATLAASVLGACLGFTGFKPWRSRKHLGTGASLFLGFLLALTAFRLRPTPGAGGALAALACLVVPLADIAVVALPRFLTGRSLWRPGADQLAHRLRGLGVHRRGIILTHVGASLTGGGAAVLSVKVRSPLPAAAVLATGVIVGLVLGFVRVGEPAPPRPVRRVLAGIFAVALVLAGVSGVVAVLAERQLNAARGDLLQARSALKDLQLPTATAALNDAQPKLHEANRLLSSPLTLPGRLIPGVTNNFTVATDLTRSGLALVAAGRQGLQVLGTLTITNGHLAAPLVGGALDLSPFSRAAGPAVSLDRDIAQAQRLVTASPPGLLIGAVSRARTQALAELATARQVADEALAATAIIPDAFGGNGPRVWLIGAENNAELRGRGGYIGSLGVVTTTQGHVTLGGFASNARLPALPPSSAISDPPPEYEAHYDTLGAFGAWQNLTMSPSFASGGDVLLSMLQAGVGVHANGLVGVDPIALADLLEATGPVSVPGIPEPLTSANVVDWALNKIYFLYPNDSDRHDVLSGVAQAVFQRVISGSVDPRRLADAIGRSISGNHLTIYSTNPALEALITDVGIGGTLAPAVGNYLLVVGQNQSENKLDYYTQRQVDYQGQVGSDGSEQVTLRITQHSLAPSATALPDVVAGARSDIGLAAGIDRTYLSALVPRGAVLEAVSVDGTSTTDFDNLPELGRRVFGTYVEVGPGASSTVQFRYFLPASVVGHRYQLTVQNQAMVHPDALTVRVLLPDGFTVGGMQGLAGGPGGALTWTGRLTSGRRLSAEVTPGVLDRLASHL